MTKVPEIISTKDLSYIEDMFNWHFTACKKALDYSESAADKEISSKLNEVCKMHQKICQKLIKILQ